jgi:carbamoyl-phosphate synthase large subunit
VGRVTLRPLRVLLTASGAPGAARLIRSLQQNGERELAVIGTDMSERSGGRFLCDAFHTVPPGSSDEFAPAVAAIAEREGADVVFPQSSGEVVQFAANRELFAMPLLAASSEAIAACDDKWQTIALAKRAGVKAPETHLARSPEEFRAAAEALGYPERDVCMKPPQAKGSRGFRILSANVDRRWALLEARPGPLPLSVDEALEAIGPDDFPPLLVMELVTGPEHTVDGICRDGRLVLGHAKTREAMRAGLAMWFETVDRPEFVEAADRLARELGLDWLVNVQFIGDRLLEINPRISTVMYQEDLNLPYLAIRHALGEITREELAALHAVVRPTRRVLRYYEQVEWDEPH